MGGSPEVRRKKEENRKVGSGGPQDLKSGSDFISVGDSFYIFFLGTFTLAQQKKGANRKGNRNHIKIVIRGL